MLRSDLDAVLDIADAIHLAHPEDRAVLAERLTLHPAGCRVLECEGTLAGYVISHPWLYGEPPALNTLLGQLPRDPTTLYLHDLALLAEARGAGSAAKAVEYLMNFATVNRWPNLSLVAVNRSEPFWRKFGFAPVSDPDLASKLASYGDAVFMARNVEPDTR